MTVAQLSGRKSLGDLVTNISAQGQRINHLGMRQTLRATLARVNENQPYELSFLQKKHKKVRNRLKQPGCIESGLWLEPSGDLRYDVLDEGLPATSLCPGWK